MDDQALFFFSTAKVHIGAKAGCFIVLQRKEDLIASYNIHYLSVVKSVLPRASWHGFLSKHGVCVTEMWISE